MFELQVDSGAVRLVDAGGDRLALAELIQLDQIHGVVLVDFVVIVRIDKQ